MKKYMAVLIISCLAATAFAADEWVSLFDGKTLEGWTPNESPASFRVEDGKIVADGERSHLFYTGPVNGAVFKNFELKADVYVHPRGSSAIYFHAANKGPGWGVKGLPVKITNTRVAATATGGIYYIPVTYRKESPVADEQWFNIHIIVRDQHVLVKIDGETVTDYTEDLSVMKPFQQKNLGLGEGTFALQCHGKKQRVDYKNVMVKVLPD